MKLSTVSKLFCLSMLITGMGFAATQRSELALSSKKSRETKEITTQVRGIIPKTHFKGNRFATAVFTSTTGYSIPVVPDSISNTVILLSKNRTDGLKAGAIELISKGLKIKRPGDYHVEFEAVVKNTGGPAGFKVFVKTSKGFSVTNPLNVIGFSNKITPGVTGEIQGAGLLKDLKSNTEITLAIQSIGGVGSVDVLSWKISLFKLGSRRHDERT